MNDLVDTNILTRMADWAHAMHQEALDAVTLLIQQGYGVWKGLVTGTPILGKNAHDARFVAAMMIHGLTHLLTFNTQDSRHYSAITAVSPADVLTP